MRFRILILLSFLLTISIHFPYDGWCTETQEPSFANMVIGEYSSPVSEIFDNLFSHYSEAEPLVNLLETFARSQGMRAAFTENVKGEVSGRFTDLEPIEFLAGIYTAFGIDWYVLDDILHFYVKRDLERRLIYLSAAKPTVMKEILMESGLISPQLPCTVNDEQKVIVFSGPASYADGVAAAIKSYEDAYRDQQEVRVFFLKHAWADDTAIGSEKDKKVIPGVATILKEMILEARGESSQLALGTGKGAAVRHTIPPIVPPDRESTEVTAEALRKEAKEQIELDRIVASPMHTQVKGLPAIASRTIQPRILADSRSNSVIVRDAAYRIPYYEETIAKLDKPLELVEIHAAIVDVDTNFSHALGVSMGRTLNTNRDTDIAIGSGVDRQLIPTDISEPGETSALIGKGFNFSTVFRYGSDYFMSRVNALEGQGNARILGRPSVLTIDNTSASLETSTTFYIRVVGEQVVELKEVSSGTSLTVTPHIIRYDDRESQIKLSVSVEDGQEPSTGSVENDIPAVVKKTNIETQGLISHGQSLLIGGYYYETMTTSDSGIPVLMNIPAVGHLFKNHAKDIRRMERMILITPKIIDPHKLAQSTKNTLKMTETDFFRSPYSTDSGDIQTLRPEPTFGCAGKRPKPFHVTKTSEAPPNNSEPDHAEPDHGQSNGIPKDPKRTASNLSISEEASSNNDASTNLFYTGIKEGE